MGTEAALTEFIRGRLCVVGPTTADALAESLAIDTRDATTALLALESEGVVLRGRFSLDGGRSRASDRSDPSDTSDSNGAIARFSRASTATR